MEKILNKLYIGSDEDYAKLASREGWSFLRCCKEGPGGHREALGYTAQGAPKGPSYLSITKANTMALNFIDPHDPAFIQKDMVDAGIQFIDQRLSVGDNVLVACNQGHSRGPITAMLYLRAIGELPHNFIASERIFRTLYTPYDPGIGARQFARSRWAEFNDSLRKAQE